VIGEWVKDQVNGLAMFKAEAKGVRFKGLLQDDLQEGYGMELWNDGSYYKGNYHAG
jgi:hypothetical protein